MLKTADNGSKPDRSGVFRTTHWTEIFDAGSEDEPRRQAALEDLIGTYWKPVYCYLRHRGHHHEEAKDLTQGFFHEIVLGRSLIRQAERAKGRFRTFMLNALNRYATSVHRAEKAKQRVPEGGLIRLESINELKVTQPLRYTTPTEAFDYAWASALLDRVLADVVKECHEAGEAIHWGIFRARVLIPITNGTEPPSLTELCERYRISSRKKASNMIITVKRRLQGILRRHMGLFVGSDADVDEEIRDLMKIFRGSAAS